MNVRKALKGQYHAALDMLKQTIELCPDALWTGETNNVPHWQVVYHTLYFTHLYLHQTEADFTPWAQHRPDYHDLPWPTSEASTFDAPYTKSQLLEYWQIVDAFVETSVDALDLDASESGFSWHAGFPKLEHQMQNIRHIQHHTGALIARLRAHQGDAGDVHWVRHRHVS